jgi:hypothetical protein
MDGELSRGFSWINYFHRIYLFVEDLLTVLILQYTHTGGTYTSIEGLCLFFDDVLLAWIFPQKNENDESILSLLFDFMNHYHARIFVMVLCWIIFSLPALFRGCR